MLKVEIYELKRGKDQIAGDFQWDGNTVTCIPPDSELLRNILQSPVREKDTGETLSSESNPQEWLENLQFQYRSAYLRAGKPKSNQSNNGAIRKIGPSPFLKHFVSYRSKDSAGYTGKKEDSAGRMQCYQQGEHVACGTGQQSNEESTRQTEAIEKRRATPDYVGKPLNIGYDSHREAEKKLEAKDNSYISRRNIGFEDQQVIVNYTGMWAKPLNTAMRSCPPNFECLNEEQTKFKNTLEKIVDNAPPLDEPIEVYRTIQSQANVAVIRERLHRCLEQGTDLSFGSFTSTSIIPIFAFSTDDERAKKAMYDPSTIFFSIRAKTGLYVGLISAHETECEFLQGPKTKYRVVAIKDDVALTGLYKAPDFKREVIYLEEV